MRRMRAALCRRRDDDGQLAILIIGFAAILVLLVTVVVNVSKAFLVQRSLSAAADGAAVAAANAVDESAVYAGRAGDTVPLDPAAVRETAIAYIGQAELDARFVGLELVEASTDGVTATVTLSAVVDMPFVNYVSARYADGYPVQVTASARSPLLD